MLERFEIELAQFRQQLMFAGYADIAVARWKSETRILTVADASPGTDAILLYVLRTPTIGSHLPGNTSLKIPPPELAVQPIRLFLVPETGDGRDHPNMSRGRFLGVLPRAGVLVWELP